MISFNFLAYFDNSRNQGMICTVGNWKDYSRLYKDKRMNIIDINTICDLEIIKV